jgi:hypothetical protein
MKKVKTTVYQNPHFYATCYDCAWEYADHKDVKKGYQEIRKHVKKTGHIVHLERSVHTAYSLEQD